MSYYKYTGTFSLNFVLNFDYETRGHCAIKIFNRVVWPFYQTDIEDTN